MYKKGLQDLVKVSKAVGNRQDYIQGGGGNTSVKLDDELMAVKASGTMLCNMAEDAGFVALKYNELKKYQYETEKNVAGKDYNKEINDLAMASIVNVNGEKAMRPSVEAGFHAVLKRVVAHTHSVYANVYTCIKGGVDLALELFKEAGIKAVKVPAVNPGYFLTEKIIETLDQEPEIIMMQNHGIIAHGQDAEQVIDLHDKANEILIKGLDLGEFPKCSVEKCEQGYKSATKWLIDKLSDQKMMDMLFELPLYPDQLVYISDRNKIIMQDGELIYKASELEAQCIEETLAGVVYVFDSAAKAGKEIIPMTEENINYICNWDSEKYRKEALNK